MSYEIIYDKQFIKLPQENKPTMFVPLILCGSNNCTEFYWDSRGRHRERRERGWHAFTWLLDGKHFGTQEEMLKKQLDYRQSLIDSHKDTDDEYNDKYFGYFASLAIGGATRQTTFGRYQGIVKTGCKNALTVEELEKYGISVSLFTGSDQYSKEKFEKAGIEPFTVYPKTTEEFLSMYEEFQAKTKDFGIPCYIKLTANEDTLKRLRKTTNPKQKTRERVEVDKWWSIRIVGLGYFKRFTANGTRYSTHASFGKQYMDEGTAKRALKKVKSRMGRQYDIELIEQDSPTFVMVTRYVEKAEA